MIYLNLLIDYLFCNLVGINTYFILIQLDKRKLLDVIVCGLVIDFIYGRFIFNTLVLIGVYCLFKLFDIKKKYVILKNILIIFVYVLIREIFHIFL